MKIADVIEGGITGAATLSLLQEALHKVDGGAPQPFLHKSDTFKKLRKGKKNGKHGNELYVKLAGELLAHAAYFGLTGLGKKKNALLRGGLLGAAAGLGAAFLTDDANDVPAKSGVNQDGSFVTKTEEEDIRQKVLTVALYTAGGVLAGAAVKAISSKKFKKNKLVKELKNSKKLKNKFDFS